MKVKFRYVNPMMRIAGIKAVRNLSGMGLAEARALVDAAEHEVQEFEAQYDEAQVQCLMDEAGLQIVDVNHTSTPNLSSLVALACEAVKAGQYALAKDIIDVLQRHS